MINVNRSIVILHCRSFNYQWSAFVSYCGGSGDECHTECYKDIGLQYAAEEVKIRVEKRWYYECHEDREERVDE